MPLEMSLRPALSEDQVRMAREARGNGISAAALARRFKVDRAAVRNAIHGRSPYDKFLDPPPVPYGVLETDRPLSNQQVREIRLSAQAGASISDVKRRFHVADVLTPNSYTVGRERCGEGVVLLVGFFLSHFNPSLILDS